MVDHALVCHLAESSIDGLACVRHLSLEGRDSVFKFLCVYRQVLNENVARAQQCLLVFKGLIYH